MPDTFHSGTISFDPVIRRPARKLVRDVFSAWHDGTRPPFPRQGRASTPHRTSYYRSTSSLGTIEESKMSEIYSKKRYGDAEDDDVERCFPPDHRTSRASSQPIESQFAKDDQDNEKDLQYTPDSRQNNRGKKTFEFY